jgi:hypothetical protein
MTAPERPAPGRREMSAEEKLIAQWEAQHDVAARGHRCDPLGLQHQLGRERLAERTRPPNPRRSPEEPPRDGTGATARDPAGAASGAEPQPGTPARRHPWRRFRRHASEH